MTSLKSEGYVEKPMVPYVEESKVPTYMKNI